MLALPSAQPQRAYTRMETRINFVSILQLEKEDSDVPKGTQRGLLELG